MASSSLENALKEITWSSTVDWPTIQRFTFLALGYLDIAYIFYAITQHHYFASNGYPDPKWTHSTPRLLIIIPHILFGSIAIYTGTIFCFLLEYTTTSISIPPFSFIIAISMLGHAITCFQMITHVYGLRKITTPLYTGATLLCVINATSLLMSPSNPRQLLNAWATINIFVVVRFQLAVLSAVGFKLHEMYTYAVTCSGFYVIALTQMHPVFLVMWGPGWTRDVERVPLIHEEC
ncbi:hypothetical protein BC829DRAFT_405195 [Chytridium lagenaria]|nr:hypothetical protein BC829DRAFT_405195 [Chytridium lagenaria]